MENTSQDPSQEEEISNIDQFQVARSSSEEKDQQSVDKITDQSDEETLNDDAGYTEGETQFADGEGTQLNEETEGLEEDDEPSAVKSEDDADFERPDDDTSDTN